ncbi:unnamed protein product [Mesocestoides corti]|uniref:Mitochondrial DNA polymerase catalytic subunit n=1 Tax=Mesocestoides corti TaxID=53468 RepID=A0A3P6I0M9_MESCO|nr:unnamed protein product [Mesocestoides corti]
MQIATGCFVFWMRLCRILYSLLGQHAPAKLLPQLFQEAVFNEVNIQMIDRKLQEVLFSKRIPSYTVSKEACDKLSEHGINAYERSGGDAAMYINLPPLLGPDVKHHFEGIASELSKPYFNCIRSLSKLPKPPTHWKFIPGWTSYANGTAISVDCPSEEGLVFDTEVLVKESNAPIIAVAASVNGWYLWVSPRLFEPPVEPTNMVTLADLIPLYSPGTSLSSPKCIVGHFVSYDRARITEEYLTDSLEWIKEASLNSLVEVYKLYCKKDPPQDKSLRVIFEKGSRKDVIKNFQKLVTYCALDVHMTFDIFQCLWKLFTERSWVDFQERANQAYADLNTKQKTMLQKLAEDALKRHNGNDKSYERDPWLWDLDWSKPKKPASTLKWGTLIPGRVPKPVGDPQFYKQNSNLKENRSSHALSIQSPQSQILPSITVVKTAAAGPRLLQFPYREYLQYWEKEIEKRLFDLNSRVAFKNRVDPTPRDKFLLDELRRSVEVMPLDFDVMHRLIASFKQVSEECKVEQFATEKLTLPIYEYLGELQVRNRIFPYQTFCLVSMCSSQTFSYLQVKGALFWQNKHRYDTRRCGMVGRQKIHRRTTTDTINPEIATCWFCPLPNEVAFSGGQGLPVGSPLSKPFQVHIASGRLHSAQTSGEGENQAADQILRDRIRASFWQSYSKRVMSQMYVFLPTRLLPPTVQSSLNEEAAPRGQLYGAILPQVIAAGTISRRAVEPLWLTASNAEPERLGSEIKAMVQAPPGYCIVGADVDSQEMWIASLIGDSKVGFQGKSCFLWNNLRFMPTPIVLLMFEQISVCGTPYGWMTLEGSKAKGTDLHTKTANLIGIKRNEAKVLNYARLYGSGVEFTKHLLSKFQSNIRPEEASLKAEKLMRATKGYRVSVPSQNNSEGKVEYKSIWRGGTESHVFNALEAIARSPEPRTPVLGAQITRALTPKAVQDDFLPSRINWVVQSSAVDYLHCLLVSMAWLIKKFNLRARLCISIHDEVRYLCYKRCADEVALALQVTKSCLKAQLLLFYPSLSKRIYFFQISNLLTRSFFAYQLGMHDLPESAAYFSSVEVDSCLRKDPLNDCKTPSNPDGLEATYKIPKGKSFTIAEIIERTGGVLKSFNDENNDNAANASYRV